MNLPNYLSFKSKRTAALMCVCALAMFGCSGSSDSVSNDNQQAPVDSAATVDSNDNDDNASNNPQFVAESETANEVVSNPETVHDIELPDSSNPSVVDPLIQSQVLVSFDISVPAYQSNELRVELTWGDLTLAADWIGDEFWTVSSELTAQTEQLLTVTYFDKNGAIVLARFSQQFKTSSNATEAFQISADQFGADEFDDDGDGANNLDELIAGKDPTLDEDSLLEIRDSYRLTDVTWVSVTTDFEFLLSEVRPISTTTHEQTGDSITEDTDIQIDLDGNGTLTYIKRANCPFESLSGIRTNAGNAISWEVAHIEHDCDFTRKSDLTNTITIVDENTRTLVEEVTGRRYGSFTNTWESSTNLTGRLVEGTSLCEPVAGTYSLTYDRRGGRPFQTIRTFVSKEIDDPYWRVEREVTHLVYFLDTLESTIFETSEYFVRELNFLSHSSYFFPLDSEIPENPELFICDFVDI